MNTSSTGYQRPHPYISARSCPFLRWLPITQPTGQLGPLHPQTAASLHNLAALYDNQGRFEEAEPLFQRALAIFEHHLGADHPDTARSQWWIATLLHRHAQLDEARPIYEQALKVYEHRLGTAHPDTQALRTQYEHLLHQMQP